jgi:hypothetical protein
MRKLATNRGRAAPETLRGQLADGLGAWKVAAAVLRRVHHRGHLR